MTPQGISDSTLFSLNSSEGKEYRILHIGSAKQSIRKQ